MRKEIGRTISSQLKGTLLNDSESVEQERPANLVNAFTNPRGELGVHHDQSIRRLLKYRVIVRRCENAPNLIQSMEIDAANSKCDTPSILLRERLHRKAVSFVVIITYRPSIVPSSASRD